MPVEKIDGDIERVENERMKYDVIIYEEWRVVSTNLKYHYHMSNIIIRRRIISYKIKINYFLS